MKRRAVVWWRCFAKGQLLTVLGLGGWGGYLWRGMGEEGFGIGSTLDGWISCVGCIGSVGSHRLCDEFFKS